LIKALKKAGYVVDRQRGSHIVLRRAESPHRRVVVPDHQELAKGTLRAILRQTGITKEELLELLR
jgi:predicted RNA binding protein YcfA (HicA-like mRNA interferase family)